MKERKFQYSIWAPIIRNKLKKQEEKKGDKLTKDEKSKIIKKEKRKCRVRAGVVAVAAALGFAAGYSNTKLLPEGKENKIAIEETAKNDSKTERQSFLENNKVKVTPTIDEQEESFKLKDILEEYNYNIESENIKFIESNPGFLYVDKNNNYIFDYREKTNEDSYITNDKDNQIGNVYTLINKKDNTIFASIGEVNSKIVNINAKQVKTVSDNKEYEYLQGKNIINLTKDKNNEEKSQETLEKIYSSIQKEHQQSKEQKEIEER